MTRREAPPGLRADYKVSFLPGECLRISNKAAILSLFATDNEAAQRRVGPFSFFVYSPANWFCGIHRVRPFPPPRLSPPRSRFVVPLPLPRSPIAASSQGEGQSYFGVRKYTRCRGDARGGCQSSTRGGGHVYCHRQNSAEIVRLVRSVRSFVLVPRGRHTARDIILVKFQSYTRQENSSDIIAASASIACYTFRYL